MKRLTLAVWIGAALLSACGSSEDASAVTQAITDFHTKLDAGEFQVLYRDASDELKQATSESDFILLLSAIHRKLGNSGESTQTAWNTNWGTAGTTYTLNFTTHFQGGDAVEQFVYRVADHKVKLFGYHINSNALILK